MSFKVNDHVVRNKDLNSHNGKIHIPAGTKGIVVEVSGSTDPAYQGYYRVDCGGYGAHLMREADLNLDNSAIGFSTFKAGDSVKLTKDYSLGAGKAPIGAGSAGTVTHVHPSHGGFYIVDFGAKGSQPVVAQDLS